MTFDKYMMIEHIKEILGKDRVRHYKLDTIDNDVLLVIYTKRNMTDIQMEGHGWKSTDKASDKVYLNSRHGLIHCKFVTDFSIVDDWKDREWWYVP